MPETNCKLESTLVTLALKFCVIKIISHVLSHIAVFTIIIIMQKIFWQVKFQDIITFIIFSFSKIIPYKKLYI